LGALLEFARLAQKKAAANGWRLLAIFISKLMQIAAAIGIIDDVRVYNCALPVQEAGQHYLMGN